MGACRVPTAARDGGAGRWSGLALVGRLQVVEAQLVARVLVELAVQLTAIGAAVELADESFVPHRVADDTGLFDQDLLLQLVDDLLPAARLDVVIEHHQAVRMWLAPDHRDLSATLVLCVDYRPRLRGLATSAADEPKLGPE